MKPLTMRVFVAVALSRKIQYFIEKLQEDLKKTEANIKWVIPKNTHITLKFIGNISLQEIQKIKKEIDLALKNIEPFIIRINKIETFPASNRPHIVSLSINLNNPLISKISKKINEKLQSFQVQKENQPFHPHITIGRLKSTYQIKPFLETLAA